MPNESKTSFNPWPVSIAVFFAVAISGAVAFVIFCTQNKTELVTTDYYEQEVRYQDQLDRVNRAASLLAPANIKYDTNARLITLTMPADHLQTSLKGWIHLYRPSAASMDQKLELQVDAAGAQSIDARRLTDGLWHVRVSWTLNGADYFFDQKLIIGERPVAPRAT